MENIEKIANFLSDRYGYSRATTKNIEADRSQNDLDAYFLKTRFDNPYLYFIYFDSKEEDSEAIRKVYESFPALDVIICFFESDIRILRKRRDGNEYDYISTIDSFKILPFSKTYSKKYANGNSEEIPRKLDANVENLFFDIHSYIRDIDGLHADEALDELCKLLYAKLYDEETTEDSQRYNFQRNIYSTIEECSSSIKQMFLLANEYDLRVYSLKIPGYKRSRGVFDIPIKLSSRALHKVVEMIEGYDFSDSSIDIKGRAFQKLYLPALRAGMGQYFTPSVITKFIVEALKPKHTDLILDPFAGSGHFLSSSLDYVRENNNSLSEKLMNEFAFHKLHGIEKSERMVRVAMTDMRLHGDGHSNLRCTDSLLHFDNYQDLQEGTFDIVLTNPPFGSMLGKDAFSSLGEYSLTDGKNSIPLEIAGLERSIQFLRPNGRIAIVLPESVLINSSNVNVRRWLLSQIRVVALINLPPETFTPYGANIKTFILIGQKWPKGSKNKQDYNIFLAESQGVGYDSNGRITSNFDLDKVLLELEDFYKQENISYAV